MKKFREILEEFKKLNLPDKEYAVYGSGPLAIRGIRETNDLDVLITDELYQKLKEKYPQNTEKDKVTIGKIEMFPSWNWMWGNGIGDLKDVIGRAEIIENVRFILLDDLVICKREMGRKKDLEDIDLIEKYLRKRQVVQ